MNLIKLFYIICTFSIVTACSASDERLKDSSAAKDQDGAKLDGKTWKIENGKFYENGKWIFLKIAKPLRNFADETEVQGLINDLDRLKDKHYNTIEINCYWHHFDVDGDGNPDVSIEPLKRLINVIYAKGMYPCLSVETYAVGGGQMPPGFWSRYPDAEAIDDKGHAVSDTEYGFGSKVVSIFHEGYRTSVHNFIKKIVSGVDYKKLLYFETTVEPQYMGTINLGYGVHARKAYNQWLEENKIADENAKMPSTFPIPQSFIDHPIWNNFRAQFLAKWVNEDARAFREVAGKEAYVAVDYLDADEHTMQRRLGIPEVFLEYLTEPNIIQVNWSWYFPDNKPNQKAYDRVKAVMKKKGYDWAITEHMTFNGSDFVNFTDHELQSILLNTLHQGTRFGWEFVSVGNSTQGSFSLYNDDWTPKRVMGIVDNQWTDWLKKIEKIEYNSH